MDDSADLTDHLFQAEVAVALCGGSARAAERRFGWGRDAVATGLGELRTGLRGVENFPAKGRVPVERANPQMGYRLTRIRKGKPLQKVAATDAIFAHVQAVQAAAKDDPQVLEISVDTKAKVAEGADARGGKTRTGSDGTAATGWDHDPPAAQKWTPPGILMVASGALPRLFGSKETSDIWADGLARWWELAKGGLGRVRRRVVYRDNGPNNSGARTPWLKRLVAFADATGLEVRLVYYPPYHGKDNPVERCWSALERKWGGGLLTSLAVAAVTSADALPGGRGSSVHLTHFFPTRDAPGGD